MNIAVIILIIIGIIAIILSFVLSNDNQEENVNPNIPTELSDADKKHLNKLVDNYTKEYSKNKVKDIVSGTMKDTIQAEINKSDKQISEKIAAEVNKIDERATEDTQKLEQYYNEVTADINSNKAELEELFKKISDKEKEMKKSLGVIDEYKEGLDKLKAEIKELDAQVTAKRNEAQYETQNGVVAPQKQVSVSEAVEEIPYNAEGETEVLRGPVIDASALEAGRETDKKENKEDSKESKGFGKGKKRNKKNKKNAKNANNDSEKQEAESSDSEDASAEAENATNSEANDSANNFANNSNVETPDLDDMLSAEGISLTEGDTVGNIMEMFNAGFSIIEISKVLGIGVGEIKAIIDKQQGE